MQQQQKFTVPNQNYVTTQTTTTQYTQPPIKTTTNQYIQSPIQTTNSTPYNFQITNTQIIPENKPQVQFQEYQTTSPQIQQQQGILQHILPQIHQYNTNQITQQPNIKQEAAEQITLRNVSPLPPPPPGGFDLNSHFVRNVPIYESDPRYINKKINIQLNTPTQGVVTTQITPVIQTVNQIKTGPPVLNNATPVLNQVGVTQLNNISPGINIGTGVNQIGTGVTAVNNVTSGLNQVNTGLTGINKIENEVSWK